MNRALLSQVGGVAFLPQDTAIVIALSQPLQLVAAAQLAASFEEGEEPYDRAIEAASMWATGLPLKTLDEVRAAGLDVEAPWSLAWLDADRLQRVVFGRVGDAAKLRTHLESAAASAERDLLVEELDNGATTYRTRFGSRRVVLLRGEQVYFIHGDLRGGVSSGETAKQIAAMVPTKGLAALPAFSKALERVAFGRQLSAFINPKVMLLARAAHLTSEREAADSAYERLEEMQQHMSGFNGEDRAPNQQLVRLQQHLAYKTRDLARIDARLQTLDALGKSLTALAFGFDVHATTLRAKIALLGDPGALLGGRDPHEPASAITRGALPVFAFEGKLGSALLYELLAESLGTRSLRRVEREVEAVGLRFERDLEPFLDGRVALIADERAAGQAGGSLALGLKDAAALRKALQRWRISPDGLRLLREGSVAALDDGLRVAEAPWGAVELRIVGDELRIATLATDTPIEPDGRDAARSWLRDSPDPLVAALAEIDHRDGLVALDARMLGTLAATAPVRRAADHDVFEALRERHHAVGRFGLRGFARSNETHEPFVIAPRSAIEPTQLAPAKPVAELRDEQTALRGDRDSLRQRQRVARQTGSDRLLTALGRSMAVARVTDDGTTLYAAQRLGEDNLAALFEWALWSLVEDSGTSETARQLATLEQRIADIDDALSGRQRPRSDVIDRFEAARFGLLE